ncbi:MAG TPA: helix-turn-helix domain-containing protein [Spirochaetia bacterium]|nr:helix-turn-helix domain-containing protein [Spirochaetia bacterium]
MSTGLMVFSNLIAPLVTGFFFCICFMYFVIASPSKGASFKYFVVFLISFGAFSFGRPLQLIVGEHPLPLIIVNLRVFILCAVISPAIILAADIFNKKGRRLSTALVVLPCVMLGLTYVVFNTLGTQNSFVLFEFGGIVARDNLTPSLLPPFYGREVTIGVQFVTGMLLLMFSSLKLIKLRLETRFRALLKDKNFLINIGILVFAMSFIIGSLAKQWWIYYAASIVSALLFGAAVLIDAQEIHRYYEKLIPFIKEDIIHNVAFSEISRSKLMELLNCLGKKSDLDTFVVVKIKEPNLSPAQDFAVVDKVLETANRCLSRLFGAENYLLLPLAGTRIGIALRTPGERTMDRKVHLLETLEAFREEISASHDCTLAIGVGRSFGRIEDLRTSYHESLSAQEYAEQFTGSTIIHVEDIDQREQHAIRYPVKEKERLISQIRMGDVEASRTALVEFFEKFRPFIEERPELLRVRLYELIGSFIDAAVLGGGDEERLDKFAHKYTVDVDLITDPSLAEKWLQKAVVEIAGGVTHVRERRTNSLIARAVTYIEANYHFPLSYKDVAREMGISPSYFLNLFKKETGTTFVDHLTAVRIEAAKQLLLTSDSSITQIAFDVGFNSSNYFSSIFRKLVGVPAKEFRDSRLLSPEVLGTAGRLHTLEEL